MTVVDQSKIVTALELITQVLVQSNVTIPIIFGAISGITAIIKAWTGTGPSVLELADLIQKQLDQNDTFGQTEIANLRNQLSAIPPPPV